MKYLILICFIVFGFSRVTSAQYDETPAYVRIKASVNPRTQPNFIDTEYIFDKQKGPLPPGTEGEILDVENLKSGNKGIKIKILKSSKVEFIGKSVWVYHNEKDPQHKHFLELAQDPKFTLKGNYKKNHGSGDCSDCHRAMQPLREKQAAPLLGAASNLENYLNTLSEKASITDMIKNYSTNPKVEKTVKCALKAANPSSIGKCYKFIKEALACGGLVDKAEIEKGLWRQEQHRFAKSAEHDLVERGFVNKLKVPEFKKTFSDISQAPKGAILIYKGPYDKRMKGPRYHIEMKTDSGAKARYVSDFISPNPVTTNAAILKSKEYELVAVMIKPPERL